MQWQSRKSSSTFSGFAAGNDISQRLSRQSPNGHASMSAWLVARGNKPKQFILVLSVGPFSETEYFAYFDFQFVLLSLYGFPVYPARP